MALSPMMKQYLATKENYPDCILMYRLGDFYEMFFDDAITASEILGLVLTGRDCGDGKRASMCGVPHHAVEGYMAKLISAGQKVAICEQLTQPAKGTIVERDVVRVVTPGTIMEDSILTESKSNYIAGIFCTDSAIGCAIADISTGLFVATQFDSPAMLNQLQELLVAYKPSEIICNSGAIDLNKQLECIRAQYVPPMSKIEDKWFEAKVAKEALLRQFEVATLDGYGLRGKAQAVSSSGALIKYLLETQKRQLPHIKSLRYVDDKDYMSIDIKTRKNLELLVSANDNKKKGSLLWLLDKTTTSAGSRMLAGWIDRPLQSATAINMRLDGVEELYRSFVLRDNLAHALSAVKDIERIVGRLAYNTMSPRDYNSLCRSLKGLPDVKECIFTKNSKIIKEINSNIHPMVDVVALLSSAIVEDAPLLAKDGGYIKEGFNAELDQVVDLCKNGKYKISQLEEYERNRSGIRTLKLGYNKVFGYYFEVSNSFKDSVPSDFIRKQTTVNGERFVSQQLKELEEKIISAEGDRLRLEKQLLEGVRNTLLQYIVQMQTSAKALAVLDCLLSLARVATEYDYVRPTLTTKNTQLSISEGRHPVVENFIKRDNFISNDTLLDTTDNRTMILTGPNMSGKSTYMRQVALIVLMAHIGSYVPASSATVPITDRIFTRVGASDDLSFNQSTFMVEMVEVANIIHNATVNSLVILDEVGRGTSTFDGLSIAWAIMEHISKNITAKTLFATHYHELIELEGKVDGVKNYHVSVKEHSGGVLFLHKISRGGANKSFGIEVAKLAGVPDCVCDRAREIANLLEASDITLKIDDISSAKQQVSDNKLASQIVSIIKDIDINKCSPIEAFEILIELTNKVK